MRYIQKNQGYITLFTVLILTGVLLIVVMSANISGFQANGVILNSLKKERSRTIAESCISYARARLAQNSSYRGNETLVVSDTECRIDRIDSNMITVRTVYEESETNVTVTIDRGESDIPIVEWQELTN